MADKPALPSHVEHAVERLVKVVDTHIMRNMMLAGQLNGLSTDAAYTGDKQTAQNGYAAPGSTERSLT